MRQLIYQKKLPRQSPLHNPHVSACSILNPEGEPVAFMRIFFVEETGFAYISDLVVKEELRGTKLSLAIMSHAKDAFSSDRQTDRVGLVSGEPEEIKFYKSLGFNCLQDLPIDAEPEAVEILIRGAKPGALMSI